MNSSKFMKKCLTSLAIRKMQTQTTLIFHFTVRRAVIKITVSDVGEDVGEKEPLGTADGTVN
jgi:hypothetical protein